MFHSTNILITQATRITSIDIPDEAPFIRYQQVLIIPFKLSMITESVAKSSVTVDTASRGDYPCRGYTLPTCTNRLLTPYVALPRGEAECGWPRPLPYLSHPNFGIPEKHIFFENPKIRANKFFFKVLDFSCFTSHCSV